MQFDIYLLPNVPSAFSCGLRYCTIMVPALASTYVSFAVPMERSCDFMVVAHIAFFSDSFVVVQYYVIIDAIMSAQSTGCSSCYCRHRATTLVHWSTVSVLFVSSRFDVTILGSIIITDFDSYCWREKRQLEPLNCKHSLLRGAHCTYLLSQ